MCVAVQRVVMYVCNGGGGGGQLFLCGGSKHYDVCVWLLRSL